MINLILWSMVGALFGWLAGYATNDRERTPSNIMIGITGAMIGGFLFNYNTSNLLNLQNPFNPTALLASFIGAIVLLTLVRLVRRVSVRSH